MYDPFHFVNIYATKGIEYLWVLGYLAVFVPFIMVLRRAGRKVAQPAMERRREEVWSQPVVLPFPDGLFFHPGHTWAKPLEDGTVAVGMDAFARSLTGPIDGVELPAVGTELSQGDVAYTVRVRGVPIPMVSPVDGTVVDVNQDVSGALRMADKSLYEQGWLLKVKPERPQRSFANLLRSQEMEKLSQAELETLMRKAYPTELGMMYQDGGAVIDGIAQAVSPDNWPELLKGLFRVKS